MKVLVYDTETGGLDAEKHSIFSVGALVGDLDTGEIIEQFEALHKLPSVDDYVFTPKAIEIHGITPQQAFAKGLTTEEIGEEFMDLWHDHGASIIGGHNEHFDRRFMSRQIYDITVSEFEANFTYRAIDSMSVVRACTGHENIASGATLGQAIKWFKMNMSEYGKNKFHTALFDAICSFKLLHKFRSVITQPDVVERLRA
jgi:DNA polymerase III epsilon subunit-like protein